MLEDGVSVGHLWLASTPENQVIDSSRLVDCDKMSCTHSNLPNFTWKFWALFPLLPTCALEIVS